MDPLYRAMSPTAIWLNCVLVAFDQLGNALAGGEPDVTISTRVGFHCHQKRDVHVWHWALLRTIIDFTFSPIDGGDHCDRAYRADTKAHHENGSDVARAILGLIVLAFCVFLIPITRILKLSGFVRNAADE